MQNVGSVVPGLEPLGIDLLSVGFHSWVNLSRKSVYPSLSGNFYFQDVGQFWLSDLQSRFDDVAGS